MDTLTPALNPSMSGSSGSEAPRVIRAQFGDGYAQSSPDGLNVSPLAFNAMWENMLNADAESIKTFLRAHVGQTFYYLLPSEVSARKWQASKWSWNYTSGETQSLTVSLEEHFDLSG